MSSGKTGTPDPGWNDPPLFSYDKAAAIQQASAIKKGPGLSKRVPFPLSGGPPKSPSVDPTLPPSSDLKNLATPPSSVKKVVDLPTTEECRDPPASEEDVSSRLNDVMRNLGIEDCDENIRRRVKLMENMWCEGKLDVSVQTRMLNLSQAVACGDKVKADNIHKSLMVDFGHQCSSWMSAVRHIINNKMEDSKGDLTLPVQSDT